MDYYTFCELQPGDLVAVNRGRFKGRMFEVESVDYDEEVDKVLSDYTLTVGHSRGSLDFVGKKPGRGAYVCRSIECLKLARKARRLERAFSCKIPEEIYDRLENEMLQGEH